MRSFATMTPSSLFTLAALFLLQVVRPASAGVCHICGARGNQAMAFPEVILANVNRSCRQIAMDIATSGLQHTDSQCTAKQNVWHNRCCSGRRPAGRNPSGGLPPQNIPSVQYVGPHPACNICRDGDYPYKTSMVINFLYIGEGSCAQYWRYGKEGRIANHMCAPVKYFSYEPCGCGEFNPYHNPNHPANQQAGQSPGNSGGGGGGSGGNPSDSKTPDNDGKDNVKMSGDQRGGAGGRRQRRLKGAAVPAQETSLAVVEV